MSSQIQTIKEKLNSAIAQLCETAWMFAKDPTRDFTRERKIPLREVISVLLCMEGGSLTGELLRYFGCNQHTASSSAFIQQRQKINEFAFPSLFDLFIRSTDRPCLYKGYRLLAADGSDIQIPADAGIFCFQQDLELQGQGEVIFPSFVGQSGIAGAQHDHQLGAVRPIHQGVGAQLTSAAL